MGTIIKKNKKSSFLGKIEFSVKIVANAQKTEFVEQMEDGTYKIRVHAPREKGKANKELLRFLKKKTGSSWEISAGKTSSRKKVKKIDTNSCL